MFDGYSGDSDLNLVSSDHEAQIMESESNFITPLISSIQTINSNPPSLDTYTNNSAELNTIAENFHHLMSSPGVLTFNSESRDTIEKAICAFVYEINRIYVEKGKEFIQKSENQKNQLKNEIKQLKEDIEMLYLKNSQVTKKLNSVNREYEKQLLELKEKNDSLEEANRNLQHSIKSNETTKIRLENQLNESKDEITQLKTEISALKNKLKSKTNIEETTKNTNLNLEIQVHDLETENQKLKVSINDYKHQLEKAEKKIEQSNPENLTLYEDENKKYRTSLLSVMTTLENQATEISTLQSIITSQREVLSKSLKFVDVYDNKINVFQKEIDELQRDNTKLNESNTFNTNELKKVQKYKDQFKELKKLLNIQSSEEEDDESIEFFELIKKSLGTKQEITDEKAQIMYTLIENQIRFLTKLISTNQIDLFTLTNRDKNTPITEDDDTKDQILMELARFRQFLAQNGLNRQNNRSNEQNDSNIEINDSTGFANRSDISESNIDITKITKDREILDFISSLILQSRTIQEYCEKLKVQSSKNMTILQEIISGIEYDDNIDDLPAVVINNIISLTDTIEEIKKIVGEENSTDLIGTIKTIASVYQEFDEDIRNQISFDGSSTELPAAVHQYIERLIENNRLQSLKIIEKCKNKIDENQTEYASRVKTLEEENEQMKRQLEHQSQELLSKSDRLAQSEKETENLNSQIEEMTKKQNESLSRMKESIDNCNDLQNDAERLRDENKKLRDSIDQKAKQTETQFNSILEDEKQNYLNELDSLKKNFQSRESKLIEKLKKTQDKYHSMKDKLKEVMTIYEEAFKKQKLAVAQIKSRNDDLVEELSNARKSKTGQAEKYYAENIRLNFNLKSLQIEKQNLKARIDQLTEKCNQIQTIRDNYWTSQISMKESEIKKKEAAILQAQNEFINELISKISNYAPKPINISQKYDLNALKSIVNKIEDDEYLISSLQAELSKPSNNYYYYQGNLNKSDNASFGSFGIYNQDNDDDNKPIRLNDSDWEKWAREMYSSTMDGDVSTHSPQELRNILGEMIIASISQRDLVKKLKSLRIQKNLLLRDAPLNNLKSNRPPQFKVICIVVLTAKKLLMKNNVSLSLLRK